MEPRKRTVNWKKMIVTVLAIVVPFLILLPLLQDYARHDMGESDIRQIYKEGERITKGQNPYNRIIGNDPLADAKYPTYLPGFYLLAALTKNIAGRSFTDWLNFWRLIFLFCHLGVGYLIFFRLWRHSSLTFAILGSSFWLFNRWSLMVLRIAHLEPLAIFLLVLSLVLLRRHFFIACLLFGASLAVKQIAVFMLPLYVLWAWRIGERDTRVKDTLIAVVCCLAIPLAVSAYHFIDEPVGFMKSILYSVNRKGEANVGNSGDFEIPSIDMLLRIYDHLKFTVFAPFRGLIAKVFLFGLMLLTYGLAYRQQLRPFALSLMIMLLFADFHSVFFPQYVAWPIALIPLALSEVGTTAKRQWRVGRRRARNAPPLPSGGLQSATAPL